jgi:hypothetical protein
MIKDDHIVRKFMHDDIARHLGKCDENVDIVIISQQQKRT